MTLLRDIVLHLFTSLIVFGAPYGVFELRFVAVFEELRETGPVEDGESRPKMNLEPIGGIGDFALANHTLHLSQLLSSARLPTGQGPSALIVGQFFRVPLSPNNGEGRANFSMRSAAALHL
jgi:hypothetical protein